MKKAIFALFTALCISSTAFAALEVEVLDNGLKFTGTVDEDTVIFVYAPNSMPEDLDGLTLDTQFSLLGKIAAEDKFIANSPVNKTFVLPDDAICGEYSVFVKTGDEVTKEEVLYTNVNAVTYFFDQYANPSADMLVEFSKIADILGIDLTLFNTLTPVEQTTIIGSFATIDASDAKTAAVNLKKKLSGAMILKALSGTSSDFASQCFSKYAKDADILLTIYNELSAEQICSIINNIVGKGYDENTIKTKLDYYCIVYGANIQPTWKKLKDYIIANSNVFTGINSFEDSVWNKLIDKLPISEASDVASKLDEIKSSLPKPISGGGSSSSGGGGTTTAIINVPKPQVSFADIPADYWAYSAIQALANRKILSGYPDGKFKPSDNILREQAAVIFVNAFYSVGGGKTTFSDAVDGAWYCPYLAAAENYGFISGYGSKFGVGETITRQDFAVMLYRILSAKGYNFEGSTVGFSDSKLISDYAKEAIEKLRGENIISGNEGRFAPLDGITRAEAAQMVYSVLK